MTAKKEKWAQEGSEFTTSITRGDSSKVLPSGFCREAFARQRFSHGLEVRVEEGEGSSQLYFDIDVLQGVLVGHWNYGLEKMRRELTACFGQGFLALVIRFCMKVNRSCSPRIGLRAGLEGAS